MTQDWTSRIAGVRMELDGEFAERIQEASLSSQQWSLVMTATEFEIENPETPEEASLVANTESLPAVAEEMARVEQSHPGAGGDGGSGGGIFGKIKEALGGASGPDVDYDEAESLADDYARRLQQKLDDHGRWVEVCEAASGR